MRVVDVRISGCRARRGAVLLVEFEVLRWPVTNQFHFTTLER